MLDAVDTTGMVGMTEPVAAALAGFRAFNFDRIYLRPAARRQAGKVIALLRGLVDVFVDTPSRMPGEPDLAPGSVDAPPRPRCAMSAG